MKYNPHDYQTFATNFVLEHPYCGLILDMGLGKSVITLTALWDLLLDSFDACRVLVVAPKPSLALCEQVRSMDKAMLGNRVGRVISREAMSKITHALQVQIGAVAIRRA